MPREIALHRAAALVVGDGDLLLRRLAKRRHLVAKLNASDPSNKPGRRSSGSADGRGDRASTPFLRQYRAYGNGSAARTPTDSFRFRAHVDGAPGQRALNDRREPLLNLRSDLAGVGV